jgi:hypothetical protein
MSSDVVAGPALLPIFKLQPITIQQLTPEGKALLRAKHATANIAWADEEEKEDSKQDDGAGGRHRHGQRSHGKSRGNGGTTHAHGSSGHAASGKRSSMSQVQQADHSAQRGHGKKRATLGSLSHLQPHAGSLTNVRADAGGVSAVPSGTSTLTTNPRWSTSNTDLRKELGTSLAAIELHSSMLKETLAAASQLCPTTGTRTAQYRRKMGITKLRALVQRFEARALQRAVACWVQFNGRMAAIARQKAEQK